MAVRRKQAGEQLAFRGDPRPGARAAERLGDTGDYSDLTTTVTVTPPHGSFALVIGCDFFERQFGVDAADYLHRRHHLAHLPTVRAADIHELNEAQNVWRTFEVPRHRHDVLIILATLDHHIDLDRAQTDLMGHIDAVQDFRHREVHVVHRLEGRLVERVQRDCHPLESGVFERLCLDVQCRAVGG